MIILIGPSINSDVDNAVPSVLDGIDFRMMINGFIRYIEILFLCENGQVSCSSNKDDGTLTMDDIMNLLSVWPVVILLIFVMVCITLHYA